MRVVLSSQAEQDLSDLFDFIASDASLDRAEAILTRIDQTLSSLAFLPRIGRVRTDLNGEPRVFTVWPWVILYEPVSETDGILVWRVLDGRRDLPSLVEAPKR